MPGWRMEVVREGFTEVTLSIDLKEERMWGLPPSTEGISQESKKHVQCPWGWNVPSMPLKELRFYTGWAGNHWIALHRRMYFKQSCQYKKKFSVTYTRVKWIHTPIHFSPHKELIYIHFCIIVIQSSLASFLSSLPSVILIFQPFFASTENISIIRCCSENNWIPLTGGSYMCFSM